MWLINPKKTSSKKRSHKRRKRSKKNPFLTIANRGKKSMAKRRRRRVKRYARANRKRRVSSRRRGGLSLAPRRVVIMRANPRRRRKHAKRRRYGRNPGLRGAVSIPRFGGLIGPAIGMVGGFAGPYLVEPLVPMAPTSGLGLFAKRAIASAVTGIAGNIASNMRLISPKTARYVWYGVAANLIVNFLKTQSVNLPGFSGLGYVNVPGVMPPASAEVARYEPYLQ